MSGISSAGTSTPLTNLSDFLSANTSPFRLLFNSLSNAAFHVEDTTGLDGGGIAEALNGGEDEEDAISDDECSCRNECASWGFDMNNGEFARLCDGGGCLLLKTTLLS